MLKPDPRFNSKLVSKFINCLMWDGKKTVAQKVFYDAMDQIVKKDKDKDVPAAGSLRDARSTTSSRTSKCAPSASAEPTTRCRCR